MSDTGAERKPKVLFIQSFSENIYDLNDLTFGNHVRYFNRHGYSFMFVNEKYDSGVFSFRKVKKYLDDYDVVVTLGCDCVITNPDIGIEGFSDNYVAVSQESAFSARFRTYCNGEIMIFNRKDNMIFALLDELDAIQTMQREAFNKANPNPPPGYFYSTQSLFNNLYEQRHPYLQYIDYVGIGKLQSYINKYVAITVLPDEEWRPGRFLMHVFGVPNDKKIERLREFFNDYSEYR